MASKRDSALELARHGIPVFPLHTVRGGRCTCSKGGSCKNKGKHPRFDERDLTNGFHSASRDLNKVRRWWDRWPDSNIGMPTGRESGFVVLDLDKAAGIKEYLDRFGYLPETIRVKTGRGGLHLYFRCTEPVDSSTGVWPNVDFRAELGYVVVPPGSNEDGDYIWENIVPVSQVPILPREIYKAVNGKAQKPLESLEWSKKLEEGQRDVEITRRAGKLLRNDIPPQIVERILQELDQELCNPPLGEAEITKIVRSVLRIETNRRGKEETERQNAFSLISWSEALRKYGGQEIEWLIEGWMPDRTVGLVVAPPGHFKTWLLADLSVAVAGGRDFMGQFAIGRTGPVLLAQQEDYMPALVSRIALMMGDMGIEEKGDTLTIPLVDETLPIFFHDERNLNFSDATSVAGLKAAIEKHKPVLVVLDPLYSAVEMDDYMAKSAQQLMVLKDMRDWYGCSFMIAHHTIKKPGDKSDRMDAWGSQFLNAWLETGWQVRDGGSPNTVAIHRHFKVAPNPGQVVVSFQITDYSYTPKLQVVEGSDLLVDGQGSGLQKGEAALRKLKDKWKTDLSR